MHVQYWGIGARNPNPLLMSPNNISTYLLQDWVPSLPASISSSFMGWPLSLIEFISHNSVDYLTLRPELQESERQWKAFLSWMLGVAGTRRVLDEEGYRWVAPVSAFYPNNTQLVTINSWPLSFSHSVVTASLPQKPKLRLRPDYLAIRPVGGVFDWAVVESKGTIGCLTNMNSCPTNWYNQVRNIEVKFNGSILNIPRHIVVATRSNPNAERRWTRRLQVRAWNSVDESSEASLSLAAAVDIASAHLFGLFRNLGLLENARALASSVQERAYSVNNVLSHINQGTRIQIRDRADSERILHGSRRIDSQNWAPLSIDMTMELGRVYIEISAATVSLASNLILAITYDEAIAALKEATTQLENSDLSQGQTGESEIFTRSGVLVRFPEKY